MAPKSSATPARATSRIIRQSATPAPVERTTRNKTPLPALDAKQSHAYGAKGKTELRSQVRTKVTDFSQALQENLEAGREDEESEEDEPAAGLATASQRSSSVLPASEARPSPPPPPPLLNRSDPNRSGTALDAGAEYDAGADDREAEERHIAAAPNSLRVFNRTLPRYVPRLVHDTELGWKATFQSTVVAALLLTTLGWISAIVLAKAPLPRPFDLWRQSFEQRLSLGPPGSWETDWYRFQHQMLFSDQLEEGYEVHGMQWFLNANFLRRVEAVERQMKSLNDDMSLQQETLTTLQKMLPSHLAVQEIDGQVVIPEYFWQALSDRLSNGTDAAPLWRAFVSGNHRQMEELHNGWAATALEGIVEKKQIVSQDYFVKAIAENNNVLAGKYQDDFKKLWASTFEHVREVAAEAAGKEVARLSSGTYSHEQLEVLTKANQLHNVYEATRNINRFSPGHGARIDPYLTSPSASMPGNWLQKAIRHYVLPKPNPPITALQRWDEATECWCAAVALSYNHTKAQITIITGTRIFPERLVVEHIPAQGTDNIAAAPRDIEIWAETNSTKEAKRFTKAIEETSPWHFEDGCQNSPGPRFVCIGKGTYDIHMHNHVQTIPMFVDLKQIKLNTDTITVRAKTNWGADWTCFYRLRMIGDRLNKPDGPESCIEAGHET